MKILIISAITVYILSIFATKKLIKEENYGELSVNDLLICITPVLNTLGVFILVLNWIYQTDVGWFFGVKKPQNNPKL
jgi:hypothetical protein